MRNAAVRITFAAALVTGAIAIAPASAFALDTTIDSGPAEGSTIDTATARFTFSSPGTPGALHECSVDDPNKYASCQSPYTTPALSNGSHTFYVRVPDDGGGTGAGAAASRQFNIAVPSAPPVAQSVQVEATKDSPYCGKTTHFSLQASTAKKKPSYCGGRFALDLRLVCPASSGASCGGEITGKWIQPSWDRDHFRPGRPPIYPSTPFSIPAGQSAVVKVGINEVLPFATLKAARKAKKAAKKAGSGNRGPKDGIPLEFTVTQAGLPAQTVRAVTYPRRWSTKHPTKVEVPDTK